MNVSEQHQTDLIPNKSATQHATSRKYRNRKILDIVAKWLVKTGGSIIIACIAGLLLLFIVVIWPLWQGAKVGPEMEIVASEFENQQILAISSDEYETIAHVLTGDGVLRFYDFIAKKHIASDSIALKPGEKITCVWRSTDAENFAIGTDQGRVFYYTVHFNQQYANGIRSSQPFISVTENVELHPNATQLKELAVARDGAGSLNIAAIDAENTVLLYRKQTVEESFFADEAVTEVLGRIENFPATPTLVELGEGGQTLFVALASGQIVKFHLDDIAIPQKAEEVQASPNTITLMDFLLGERSLIVGDDFGNLTIWFEAFNPDGTGLRTMRQAHTMTAHQSTINSFSASQRNRSFLIGSRDGSLSLQHATNERLLWQSKVSNSAIKLISMSPKGTGALLVDAQNTIKFLPIDNPHPEAGFRAYFSKIWYEGYPTPDYIWQSSGGSDDFEPKLSLIPLIFGTVKGTVYALLLALPIAILSALYVSQFMHTSIKNIVKPSMEIMAALPSVVLGFIGGLWLAPRIEPVLPGVLATIIFTPAVAIVLSILWNKIAHHFQHRLAAGSEAFILLPVILLTGYICIALSHSMELWFFGGDFQLWLQDSANVSYDQRNAFVVGLVMGFAVIPIIFTISEDALSNVPGNLSAASLALGATPWQTAWYIVLPSASPGIFSAAMIGLGRAVGETMIVLMATGNTPVMDWSIFNGFRTLSATIAVEIPEAPMGGTLFRTLFFAALLLFGMTFIINTGAELVRQRIHRKYEKN